MPFWKYCLPPLPSLRRCITRVLLLAFIPSAAIFLVDARISRDRALTEAQQSLLEDASYAAAVQEQHLQAAREMFCNLAAELEPGNGTVDQCNAYLRMMLGERYLAAALMGEQGGCYAATPANRLGDGADALIQSARSGAVVGVAQVQAGEPGTAVYFAFPVQRKVETQVAVLRLGSGNIEPLPPVPGRSVAKFSYFSSAGKFLAAYPLHSAPLERQLRQEQISRLQGDRNLPLAVTMETMDGTQFLAAIAPIRFDGSTVAYVRAVLAEDEALGGWRLSFAWRSAAALLMLAVSVALAWVLLERWLVRDMMALQEFAEKAEDDPAAEASRPAIVRETRQAQAAVVALARRLHEKNRSLQQLHKRLLDTNAALEQRVKDRTRELERSEKLYRLLAEGIPQIVWWGTVQDGVTYVNQAWRECLGDCPWLPRGWRPTCWSWS